MSSNPHRFLWCDSLTALTNEYLGSDAMWCQFQVDHGLGAPPSFLLETSFHVRSTTTLRPAGCEKPTPHSQALEGEMPHGKRERSGSTWESYMYDKTILEVDPPAPAASQANVLWIRDELPVKSLPEFMTHLIANEYGYFKTLSFTWYTVIDNRNVAGFRSCPAAIHFPCRRQSDPLKCKSEHVSQF